MAGIFSRMALRSKHEKRTRALLVQASPYLRLGDATLDVRSSGDVTRVSVSHRIEAVGPLAGALLLDLKECPFVLEILRTNAGVSIYQRAEALVLEANTPERWTGACLDYEFTWDCEDRRDPGGLSIPEHLPRTGFERWVPELAAARTAPRFSVIEDELSRGIRLFGIRDEARHSYLRALIVPEGVVYEDPRSGAVAIARQLWNKHNSAEGLVRQAEDALRYLEQLFEVDPMPRILILGQPESRHIAASGVGCTISIDDSFVRDYPVGSPGCHFELLRELTSIYWGGGCQIHGPQANAICWAIGGAVALTWAARESGQDFYMKVVKSYQKKARASKVTDAFHYLSGGIKPSLVPGWALRLHQDLLQPNGRRTIRNLTRECWGMIVPSSAVARQLSL